MTQATVPFGVSVETATSVTGFVSALDRVEGQVMTTGGSPLELSIVVPTFNEKSNVPELLGRLDSALKGLEWEVIFVDDDSPDGTAAAVRECARSDRRVRVLQRIGRRGLSSACIEGMLASSAPLIAVMDADLQHDETRLPALVAALEVDGADLAVATRYGQGGSVGGWDQTRAGMSRLATAVSRLVLRQPVSDPMSGFFVLRRQALDDAVRSLSALGFKILLDVLASSSRPLRVVEVPYVFRSRFSGESKLDSMALWDFGMLLADKMTGRYVPVRFLMFASVGLVGVVVHMGVLTLSLKGVGVSFVTGQAIATAGAMVFNFAVNNVLTYRDQRLRGRRWWLGLGSFALACSVGAVANVGVANYLFMGQTQWALAAMAGVAVGAVWNYAVTPIYTWGRGTR
jgi:dolichol-phosphate mannosyltransferase